MTHTNQEIFDKACKGVIAQGQKSGTISRCFYRGSNGLKCAVGHLIPDDKYDPEWDRVTLGIWAPTGSDADALRAAAGVSRHQADTIAGDLQRAHDLADEANFVDDFKSKAREIARLYKLNPEVLN